MADITRDILAEMQTNFSAFLNDDETTSRFKTDNTPSDNDTFQTNDNSELTQLRNENRDLKEYILSIQKELERVKSGATTIVRNMDKYPRITKSIRDIILERTQSAEMIQNLNDRIYVLQEELRDSGSNSNNDITLFKQSMTQKFQDLSDELDALIQAYNNMLLSAPNTNIISINKIKALEVQVESLKTSLGLGGSKNTTGSLSNTKENLLVLGKLLLTITRK